MTAASQAPLAIAGTHHVVFANMKPMTGEALRKHKQGWTTAAGMSAAGGSWSDGEIGSTNFGWSTRPLPTIRMARPLSSGTRITSSLSSMRPRRARRPRPPANVMPRRHGRRLMPAEHRKVGGLSAKDSRVASRSAHSPCVSCRRQGAQP